MSPFKFQNISGFPVVASCTDINSNQQEIVIFNGQEVNLTEITDKVILHNRLFDNILKYKWIVAGYDSFDIGTFSKNALPSGKNSEMYVSEFLIEFNGNKFIFRKE